MMKVIVMKMMIFKFITNIIPVKRVLNKKKEMRIFQTKKMRTKTKMIKMGKISVKNMIPINIFTEKIQKVTQKSFMKFIWFSHWIYKSSLIFMSTIFKKMSSSSFPSNFEYLITIYTRLFPNKKILPDMKSANINVYYSEMYLILESTLFANITYDPKNYFWFIYKIEYQLVSCCYYVYACT